MEDQQIIALYWDRKERAIEESGKKYGAFCLKIADNILRSHEDDEECVSDTWLRAWNAMPPEKPNVLSSFFAKITRNLALDRYRAMHAEKRVKSEMMLALDELDYCVPSSMRVESSLDEKQTVQILERFLCGLSKADRVLFLRRYWFADRVADAAKFCAIGENTAKSKLLRMRNALKAQLEEEGIAV